MNDTLAELRRRGVDIVNPPFEIEDINARLAFFRDPWATCSSRPNASMNATRKTCCVEVALTDRIDTRSRRPIPSRSGYLSGLFIPVVSPVDRCHRFTRAQERNAMKRSVAKALAIVAAMTGSAILYPAVASADPVRNCGFSFIGEVSGVQYAFYHNCSSISVHHITIDRVLWPDDGMCVARMTTVGLGHYGSAVGDARGAVHDYDC
jgi:hypothetical protein